MRQAALIAVLLASGFSVALGISKSYDVVPFGDCIAETPRYTDVVQYVRNTLDSLTFVWFWVGDTFTSDRFRVEIRDSVTGTMIAQSRNQGSHSSRCWTWLPCTLVTTQGCRAVRGKTYSVKVRRPAGGAISYAYDPRNPYQYGRAVANSTPPMTADDDIALRVSGLHDVVDSTDFGACELSWWNSLNHRAQPETLTFDTVQFRNEVETSKVRTVRFDLDWNLVQYDSRDSWHWGLMDAQMRGIRADAGCRPLALLMQIATWASTRIDSVYTDPTPNDTVPDSAWVKVPSLQCAPCSLDMPTDYTNPLARFINAVVDHYDGLQMPIHDWEIWNEPNDTTSDSLGCYTKGRNGNFGWWRRPNIDSFYPDLAEGLPGLCSLYMRMAYVVDSVVKDSIRHPGHQHDKVAIGSMHKLYLGGDGGSGLVRGEDWLEGCYGATQNGTFWDAVSIHPYMPANHDTVLFDLDTFETYAESLRSIMHGHGDYGEVWNTEFSTPEECWWDTAHQLHMVTTEEQSANNICEMISLAEGMKARPGGSFDRNYWFWLKQVYGNHGFWGLLSDSMVRHAEFFAFKQTAEQLTGKRLNGRVMTGDTLTDPLVRIYEFEDTASLKKTWVCWKTGDDNTVVNVQLPVRADTSEAANLDYEGDPQSDPAAAGVDGWLSRGIYARPKFITEPDRESLMRPDLVVDSIMVPVGAHMHSVMDIHAFVRNIGSDTTPGMVHLDFLCDTTAFITHATSEWRIPPGGTYDFSFEINPIPGWMHGWHLFSARVNPGQEYVEKDGMDDNCGYARRFISLGPDGNLIGELYGRHSNGPLPLFGIETHSYEIDTLGSMPAESARLVQWWYGLNDTVVHGGDTTAWFCVNEAVALDTSWLYLSGQGKYKLFLQVKDSWSMSDLIPDTVHPFVVFDTTAPAGSIEINSGARFVAGSSCTLRISAQDSLSSIAGMRLLNVPPANLVSDGGFVGNGGSWVYENGGYDDSLGLGWLTAAPAPATVTQFIPADSISAHAGDSCVLEASIMAHVHEDVAVGSASFWYLSTNVNPQITDTLWQLVDSAGFSGNLLSLTGRYALSKHFLLTTPGPDTNWVWQGGVVKVEASAENGNGTVYVDNAALIPYEAGSGYAWWASFDTLVDWTITSGAGPHAVRVTFIDSAGNWNATPYADTVIMDPTPPVVDISMPMAGLLVNGLVEITGVAYDTVEVPGDSWFQRRALSYRHWDSTNWLPVSPDSISYQPAWPDSMSSQGPAVHLGNWNTLPLENGPYDLCLAAADSAGNTSSCTTWVMVDHGFGGGGMRSGPEGGGSGLGEGSVFVGSSTGTVLHLSDDLDSLDAFSVDDSGSQANITAVLEVGNDSILVLDATNKRVHKLHRNGQHRRRLVSGLSQPVDLKRDANGNFWLVDRGWNRIGKFRSNGTLVFVRGGLGADTLHFNAPEGIAVKGGLVYVADGGNNRIALWDTSGHFKTIITGDFENPTAVCVMESGAIYLTDGTDGKLKGITPLGGNIVTIGTADSSKLKGLVPSENRHSLFSLASEPNKVYKLRIQSDESRPGGAQSGGRVNLPKTLALNQPFPNPARTRLNIAYALPRQTRVELKLYDVAGKLVTTLANGEQKPGYYSLTWNRQDTKGRSCACGVYFCTLVAENKRFSRKVILTE